RLVFDPAFHDTETLIERVTAGSFDYRVIPEIARAIQTHVKSSGALERYVLNLWQALVKPASLGISLPDVDVGNLLKGGASPRAVAALARTARVNAWLEGRDYLVPEDVRDVFIEVMAHRIFVDPIHALRGDDIVKRLCRAAFDATPVP
ncbi:AAA family ATPase, partial [Methylocystis sp.]|uniref:AAA family ATPase n=1 Tax=Methylocystis sp. TaxID=1911079 RepID=UPI003D0F9601